MYTKLPTVCSFPFKARTDRQAQLNAIESPLPCSIRATTTVLWSYKLLPVTLFYYLPISYTRKLDGQRDPDGQYASSCLILPRSAGEPLRIYRDLSIFTAPALLSRYMPWSCVCLSVRPSVSVTSRSSTKMAKGRNTQTCLLYTSPSPRDS